MIHYILQIIGFQLLFLLVYEVFLKKETFFTWNRVYLLLTPLVSLVLPLLKIPVLQQSIPESYKIALPEVLTAVPLQETVLDGGQLAEVTITGTGSVNLYPILTNIWYVGVLMGVLFFAYKLYQIWNLSRLGTSRKIDGIHVITLPNSTTAFSFFNTMYLGADLSETQRKSIVMHEAVHIKERHTLDLLFFEILRIVFWFNPLVYIYQKELTLLQEFQADATAVLQTDKAKYYQELLARVFQTEKISFINTFFNHSFIKKRITMLQKSKSNNLAKFKYVVLVPLMASMLFYVACSGDNSINSKNPLEMENLSFEEKAKNLFSEYENRETVNNEELKEFIDTLTELFNSDNGDQNSTVPIVVKYDNLMMAKYSRYLEEAAKQKDIPYAVIEKVPAFLGCQDIVSNKERKRCTSDKIAKYVNDNFNTDIAKPLGLAGINRIFAQFKIDVAGYIVDVKVRAEHPELEKETKRVLESMPYMMAGEQNGRPVGVLYSLPITFKIQE